MSSKRIGAVLAATVLLTGCEAVNRPIGTTDPYMGEATKWNAAVQTIDPDPVYTDEDARPGESGDKAAAAVKQVEVMETTGGSSSPR